MPGARDGQLRINRGSDTPAWSLQMFDDELGLWLTLAQADVGENAMAQGIPVLRGPYVVDYTDIPHDGDKKTLWTPQVGDVLLRLVADWQTVTQWDHGALYVGQNVNGGAGSGYFAAAAHGGIGLGSGGVGQLDNILEAVGAANADASGSTYESTIYVFHSTDPVQIQMANTGGTDPGVGHVELYAVIARALAVS